MKSNKRIKEMLGLLSILPTFTGMTDAKPIPPRQNTEKTKLNVEAKPCPMTKESKQESNTPGITNTQMGILLLGMLILPVTGIKASEKGYELVKPGFEQLKDKIGKWYAPFAHRKDIERITKTVEALREIFKGKPSLKFEFGEKGLVGVWGAACDNYEYKEALLENVPDQRRKEIVIRTDEIIGLISAGKINRENGNVGPLTLTIRRSDRYQRNEIKLELPQNMLNVTDLEKHYQDVLQIPTVLNGGDRKGPSSEHTLLIETGGKELAITLNMEDINQQKETKTIDPNYSLLEN